MSYTEDTETVLEAMKYEYTEGPDGPEAWLGMEGWRVDANFIVERVIPWAVARDLRLVIDPLVGAWQVEWSTLDGSGIEMVPTMPEAVMAAIAATLR